MYRLAALGLAALCLAASGVESIARAEQPPPGKAPTPSFFIYEDTSLSYSYNFTTREPNLLYAAGKNAFTLNHVDAWKYGTNFLNIDLLKSDSRDPEAPWAGPGYPVPPGGIGEGAFEVYALYRGALSFNQMLDTVAFTFGPVSDVSFYFGGDLESKNTALGPRKKDFVLGLQAAFKVPGYLNVAAAFYKEWNHNGIVALQGNPPGTAEWVDFNPTATFEIEYMQPLTFTGFPFKISGNTHVVLPKGRDGFGRETVAEFSTDNRLTLDVGRFLADKPNLFDVFVGYRFWLNKFGDNPYPPNIAPIPGTMESTFYVGFTWHAF